MSKPTDPGFYWAKHRSDSEFQPVELHWMFGVGRKELSVTMLGDDCTYGFDEFTWGPRIPQYEPDIHTHDTAVELPPITDADLEGA